MNPFAIGKILKDVLTYGPIILDTAEKIYKHIKIIYEKKNAKDQTNSTSTIDELNTKISQFEQNDLAQAKLLSDLAKQNDNLSKLTNALATRFLYAIIIASVSFILTIYLLIKMWFKAIHSTN